MIPEEGDPDPNSISQAALKVGFRALIWQVLLAQLRNLPLLAPVKHSIDKNLH